MSDQAEKLRKLFVTPPPVALPVSADIPMIAISGARRGVGATTVAVNLAAALADQGERVVLVDAAEPQANRSPLANFGRMNPLGLSDILTGSCRASEALSPGPVGTMVLAARGRPLTQVNCESRRDSSTWCFSRQAQQRLLRELQSLNEVASVIVVDTGEGFTPWIQRFWVRAKLPILVFATDDAAVMDAYATMKRSTLTGTGDNVAVLLNQCESDASARAAYARLTAACGRFLSREPATLPPLPMQLWELIGDRCAMPRVWDSPNTPFGHAVLWLGRAVTERLSANDGAAHWRRGTREFNHGQLSSC
jgi:flagellar biosynthesis protein FlhG